MLFMTKKDKEKTDSLSKAGKRSHNDLLKSIKDFDKTVRLQVTPKNENVSTVS